MEIPAGSAADQLGRAVLLAGADAGKLRGEVERCLRQTPECQSGVVTEAETLLDAVLMAGEVLAGRGEELLVLAGISQDIEQLESAVRSLRKVYDHAEIVLLCEPCDEVLGRKAKAWGATDYLILPADERSVRRLLAREKGNGEGRVAEWTVEKMPIRALAAQNGCVKRETTDLTLPSLPLMVQTSLMTDLMAGQAEFMKRAIATLQSYVKWNGTLRFVSAAPEQEEGEGAAEVVAGELEMPVEVAGQPSFGRLVLAPAVVAGDGQETMQIAPPALSQAAQWLGTMLSVARRYEQLRSLAITDELSGAYNRRYFNKFMSGLLERSRVNHSRVTLLLFDIDDFKQYNDRFGHASGDSIIRELIKLLRSCTREHDVVARLGGDEFAVVYWDKGAPRQANSEHPKDVLIATERFRKAIKAHEWCGTCNIQGEISISGGMATFPWDAESLEQLMAKADEALLRAKSAGKNVILLHGGEAKGEAREETERVVAE